MYYFYQGGIPTGFLPRAQVGLTTPPVAQDYPTMDAFKQALFDYENSMNWTNISDEVLNQAIQSQPVQSATAPMVVASAASSRPSYSGYSVVDLLSGLGKAADFSTRKELARLYNIPNYRGTAKQNLELISKIKNDSSKLSGVSSVGAPRKGRGSAAAVAASEPSMYMPQEVPEYLRAPEAPQYSVPSGWGWLPPLGEDVVEEASMSDYLIPAGVVTGAGLGTYAAMRQMAPGIAGQSRAGELAMTYVKPADIIGYAKKFGRDNNTFNILRAKGMSPKEINVALKGIKFKDGATQKIMSALEIGQDATKRAADVASQVKAANLEKAKRLVEVMKLKGGVRDPKIVSQIYNLVPNPAEANALLKGLKFIPQGTQIAQGARAAGMFPKFGQALRYLNRFKEEGGELEKYQMTGEVLPQPIGRTMMFDPDYEDRLGEDVFEFFDPTGASSYDDIAEMWRRQQEDPEAYAGFLGGLDKAMTYLSAVPVIGEAGKVGKGVKGFLKYLVGAEKAAEKASKLSKAVKAKKSISGKTGEALRYSAGPAIDIFFGGPLVRMGERVNPLGIGTGYLGEKALKNSPKTRKAVNFMSGAGRIGRPDDLYGRVVNKLAGPSDYQYYDVRENKVKTIKADDPRVKGWEKSGYFYFSEPDNAYILDVPGGLPLDTKSNTQEAPAPKKTQMVKSASGVYEFKRKGGSTKGYSGTYSAGVYYQGGGSFVPGYGESAYGALPKYMHGMSMQDGGSAGDEMYVTPEQMEMLRQQGYEFDVIG
jgi:hypothetical protein